MLLVDNILYMAADTSVKPKKEISELVDFVEKATIIDIKSILNKVSGLLEQGLDPRDSIKIYSSVALRADKLADKIYQKALKGGSTLEELDLEEYRTMNDIARECRQAVRDVVLNNRLISFFEASLKKPLS